MKLTNNQKAMREICDELGVDRGDLYIPNGLFLTIISDSAELNVMIEGKYLCISLHDGDITINKLNTFDEDLIIQAVKNSSFIGGLVVPTTYKIGS